MHSQKKIYGVDLTASCKVPTQTRTQKKINRAAPGNPKQIRARNEALWYCVCRLDSHQYEISASEWRNYVQNGPRPFTDVAQATRFYCYVYEPLYYSRSVNPPLFLSWWWWCAFLLYFGQASGQKQGGHRGKIIESVKSRHFVQVV